MLIIDIEMKTVCFFVVVFLLAPLTRKSKNALLVIGLHFNVSMGANTSARLLTAATVRCSPLSLKQPCGPGFGPLLNTRGLTKHQF